MPGSEERVDEFVNMMNMLKLSGARYEGNYLRVNRCLNAYSD